MKTKLVQRLIQVAAIVFLVWLIVSDVRHSDLDSLTLVVTIGAIFFANWLLAKKFPQTAIRCRVFKKMVWVFVILALLFTALSFINFDVSTSKVFSETLVFIFVMLTLTYMEQQRLAHQLIKEQKNVATM